MPKSESWASKKNSDAGRWIIRIRQQDKPFYGWYVVGACFLISVMAMGARYSFGVFLNPLEQEFGMSRSTSSSVFAVYMILCCVIAGPGGWALDRFGPRVIGLWMGALAGLAFICTSFVRSPWQLLVSYSLLLSLGTGAAYTLANSTASRWFVRKRGVVVGITSSGGGLGVVILAPLAAFLLARFDWRVAFLIMGITVWLGMAGAALLLVKDPRLIGLLPDGGPASAADVVARGDAPHPSQQWARTDFSLRQAIRRKSFWLLWLAWLTISLALHMVLVHVVPYALGMGIEAMDAALIISLAGFANIPGRLVVGRVSDRIGRNALGTICVVGLCIALVWLMRSHNLWMLYAFAMVFGFCWGGAVITTTLLMGDLFGLLHLGSIMGIMSVAWGLGAAFGPGIAGIVFDATGFYPAAFGIAAAILSGAVFCVYNSKEKRN